MHISSRDRIGLWGDERVGKRYGSTTVARSFNGDARRRSQVKVLVDHHAASLRLRKKASETTGTARTTRCAEGRPRAYPSATQLVWLGAPCRGTLPTRGDSTPTPRAFPMPSLSLTPYIS